MLRGMRETDIDFPASEFDTPRLKSGVVAPVKGLTKKESRGVAHLPLFSPIRTVVAERSWILKDDTVNKRGCNLRWDSFFFRNNYFEVPTNTRGAFRTNGTDTLKRAGSGSHLDESGEKEWWERLVSLYIPVWEINLNGLCCAAESLWSVKKKQDLYQLITNSFVYFFTP